jgi:hypothetical protein
MHSLKLRVISNNVAGTSGKRRESNATVAKLPRIEVAIAIFTAIWQQNCLYPFGSDTRKTKALVEQ